MAVIAKAYYITHINKLTIEWSSWRRPFDDLYDTINSRLDSANVSSNFGINASQVNYSDSTGFFSSTNIANVIYELLPQGYNEVHFQCYGTKLSIFPGRFEVNGALGRIKTRTTLNITAMTMISSSLANGNTYGVFFNPEANITQSDIFLYNVTANTLAGTVQEGLYVSAGSASRRGLFTFIWAENSQAISWDFLAPPVSPFSYQWTDSESLAHNLFAQSYNVTEGRVSSIIQMYNSNYYRYDYNFAGTMATNTTSFVYLLSNLSSCMEELFIFERMHVVFGGTTLQSFNGSQLKTSGAAPTILLAIGITASGIYLNNIATATLGTANFNAILTTKLYWNRIA